MFFRPQKRSEFYSNVFHGGLSVKWSFIKCFDSEIEKEDLNNPFLELKVTPIHGFCLLYQKGVKPGPHCNFNQFCIQQKSSFIYSFIFEL